MLYWDSHWLVQVHIYWTAGRGEIIHLKLRRGIAVSIDDGGANLFHTSAQHPPVLVNVCATLISFNQTRIIDRPRE